MLPVKGPAASLREVTLDDKYSVERGAIYITGLQALVKLPLIIREFDQRAASIPRALSPDIVVRR